MHKKVFLTTDDQLVRAMFMRKGWEVVDNLFTGNVDLVCFTGGSDVSPFLYGERAIPGTQYNVKRDNLEIKYWKYIKKTAPKVGICRGAQFGNIMSGGSLWQDVDNHYRSHIAQDVYFEGVADSVGQVQVSSDHHQMCVLAEDAWLLAVAKESTKYDGDGDSKRFGYQTSRNDWEDVEAFYYTDSNFLGVQFHPEYPGYANCERYFWKLVNEFYEFEDKTMQTVQKALAL